MEQEDICSPPSDDSSLSLSSYDSDPACLSDSDMRVLRAIRLRTFHTPLFPSYPSSALSNVVEKVNDTSESLHHREEAMVNPPSKTTDKKDRRSHELGAPMCPGIHHGSSDMLLNTLMGMQQQRQQHMALLQQQLAAQQQQIELQQQCFLELKESPAPTFDGSTGLLEAEKWIAEMEKFCRALCLPKDEWVNVTIPFLIDDAEAWFNSVKPTFESGGRRIDWAQFRDIFYLKYIPDTIRTEKLNEFFNLKQGGMTVFQYAWMFGKLIHFVPAFMVYERRKITRFKEGLNLNLKECMETAQPTTYQELLEQATRAERLIRERNQIRDGKRPRLWKEQCEETESATKKKTTSANKKAIQEDLDGSTVHGQDNENSTENCSHHAASQERREVDEKETRLAEEPKKQIEALQKRIIQLEKDLDEKRSLDLDFEQLKGQLDMMKHTDIEILKEAEKLRKMLIEKEAELEHQKELHNALQQKIIKYLNVMNDLYKNEPVDMEQLQGLSLDVKRELTDDDDVDVLKKLEEPQKVGSASDHTMKKVLIRNHKTWAH